MIRLLSIASLVIGVLAVAGCSKDEPAVNDGLPPAASKEAGESRATQSGGGQFSRSSDKADG